MEKDAFVKFLTFLLGPLSAVGSKNVSIIWSMLTNIFVFYTVVSSSLEYNSN